MNARSIRLMHEEAFRERAGRIGVLASCICTYPIEQHDTSTGHDERCPSHHMQIFYDNRRELAAASAVRRAAVHAAEKGTSP